MFLLKYDPYGNRIFTKELGSSQGETGNAVVVDSNSRFVYIVGGTTGNFDSHNNLGGSDNFLVKYDTSGRKIWSKQWGTTSDDACFDVVIDSFSGDLLIAGITYGALDGQSNIGGYDLVYLIVYSIVLYISLFTTKWPRCFLYL